MGEKQAGEKSLWLQNHLILQGCKLESDLNSHIGNNEYKLLPTSFGCTKQKSSDNHTVWFHDLIPVLPYFPETIALRTTTCLSRCGFTGYTVVEPAGFRLQSTFTCQYMPDRVAVQIRKHLFMPQNPQHIFPALFPVLSSMPLQLSGSQLSHCFLV